MSQSRMSPQVKDYFGRLIAEWANCTCMGKEGHRKLSHVAESAPGNQRDVDFDMRPPRFQNTGSAMRIVPAWKVLR